MVRNASICYALISTQKRVLCKMTYQFGNVAKLRQKAQKKLLVLNGKGVKTMKNGKLAMTDAEKNGTAVILSKRKGKTWEYLKRNYWLYIFILPALAWLLTFCYAPMGGVVVAFKRYTGAYSVWESKWVGLKWFESFFESYYAEEVIINTLRLSLYTLATFPLPIILALMLNEVRNAKVKRTIQTVLYAPHFISTVVICSMISLFFAQDSGFVTQLVENITGEAPKWLTSAKAFPHIYTWSGVWQSMGWNCVIYVAALSSVDMSQHEAATIDGASRLQRILHVNIPAITPTIIITLILQVGKIMSVGADKALLLKNGLNADTANTISIFVYERGLVSGDFGYGTAVGLFTNVINIILVLTVNKISEKVSETSLF